jgi:hypothetical protein
MDYFKRRRQFEETLRDKLAKLERDHVNRIDRSEVEEMGQRFELDGDEARKLFVDARGDVWQGEFVESDDEPGWEAVELKRVPSVGSAPDDSSV